MSHTPRRLLPTLAVVVLGCASEASMWDSAAFHDLPERKTLRAEALGCYALRVGPRAAPDALIAAPEFVELLPEALLDTTGARTGHFAVRPAGRNASRLWDGMASKSWRADSLTDSVRIVLADGFNGADFIVAFPRVPTDRLHGRARWTGDAGPAGQEAGVAELRRAPCDQVPVRGTLAPVSAT